MLIFFLWNIWYSFFFFLFFSPWFCFPLLVFLSSALSVPIHSLLHNQIPLHLNFSLLFSGFSHITCINCSLALLIFFWESTVYTCYTKNVVVSFSTTLNQNAVVLSPPIFIFLCDSSRLQEWNWGWASLTVKGKTSFVWYDNSESHILSFIFWGFFNGTFVKQPCSELMFHH